MHHTYQLLATLGILLSSARSSVHPPAISLLRKAALEPGHILPFLQFELSAANENREQTAQDVANVLAKLAKARGPPVRIFRDPGDALRPRHVAFGLDRWWRLPLERSMAAGAIVDAVEAARAHHILHFLGVAHTVTPEFAKQTQYVPSDPGYATNQGAHYEAVGLPAAWALTGGDASVVVQVLDSGVDEAHPDLQLNKWRNKGETSCGDGVDNDGNGFVDDCHGYNHAEDSSSLLGSGDHGCHVAGLVGATTDNGVGVAGSAGGKAGDPGCSFMVSTIFGVSNNGGFAEAIVYGADNGASISSNSWSYTSPSIYDSAVLLAINYATEQGVLVVFAAGNNGKSSRYYPAYYSYTIAVAATDNNGTKASYSNYGSHVDISAPGNNIYSTGLNGSYLSSSGTSFATPVVSGALALARSYAPERSVAELKACLFSTATGIEAVNEETYSGMLGAGLLNVPALLACVRAPTLAPSPAPSGNTLTPTLTPSNVPSPQPSFTPTSTLLPTFKPSFQPLQSPTFEPSLAPSTAPTLITSAPSQQPSLVPSRRPSSAPTSMLWPSPVPTLPLLLPSTLAPTLVPSSAATSTASVHFMLSATTAPAVSQQAALKADVVAQVAPWKVKRFAVSSSSARRRLENSSGRHRSRGSSISSSINVFAIRGSYSDSGADKRELSGIIWTATFDVVAELDSVSAAASLVTTALAEPSFSSAVATSTGATVDATSVSVVILTRKPTAAPSVRPTISALITEDVTAGASNSKSGATFDGVVLALLCITIGGLLLAVAFLLWRTKVLARANGSDKGPLANQSAPSDHSLQSLSVRPPNCRTTNPFTNKSTPVSPSILNMPGQGRVLCGVADDHYFNKDGNHRGTIELSGAVGYGSTNGESFRSVADYEGSSHRGAKPSSRDGSAQQALDTRSTKIQSPWASAENSDECGGNGQTNLENSRARWQERQWASHRAAHSSNAAQQSRATHNTEGGTSSSRNSPVLGSPLGTDESWCSEKEGSAEKACWEGTASPMHATQHKKASSPTSMAAPESYRSQPQSPTKRAPYKDDSAAANVPVKCSTTTHDVIATSTLSPPVPPIPMRQTPVVLHQSLEAPTSLSTSSHQPESLSKSPWVRNAHASKQRENERFFPKSSNQRNLDGKDDVTPDTNPATEEAALLLAKARQLKSQGNLVGASTLLERLLILIEKSRNSSSNYGLSSLDTAQTQFLLAGCLRRLSARGEENQQGSQEDQKQRLESALELYELCTTTMAQELAFINDEDENALQLAVDLASAYNDWGVGLWQRGNHGDAEAAVLCFSRALQMRRVHRGVVLMC